MKNRNLIRSLGVMGILGGLVAVIADLASGFSTAPNAMETSLSLSLRNVRGLLDAKSHWQLVLGHYLALFAIPMEGIGIVTQTFLGLKPIGKNHSRIFFFAGLYLVSLGAAYHGTYGLIAEIIQQGSETLLNQAADYFDPFGVIISSSYLVLVIYWFGLILTGRGHYPRWTIFFSPFLLMLLSLILIYLLPARLRAVKTFMTVTGLNLPLTIWGITSTLVLWSKKIDDFRL